MTQFFQRFFFLFLVSLLCASSVVSAQEAEVQRCNTDAYMQSLLQNKTYRKAYEKRQAMVAAKSKTSNEKALCATPVSLPMAIHFQGVDASAANQACLEQLAISQIQVLNDDYQGTNADISSWINTASASFPGIDYSQACLEFCLATKNHPTSSGLSDGEYAITYNAFTGDFSSDWSGYLNIFVQSGTGVLGYSPLGGSGNGDGVVVEAFAFGTRGFNCADAGPDNSSWAYDLGRTLTHEVGHYLNLNHIWGGGCNSDDGVADTPDSASPYYGCPSLGDASCSSTDMHMNYMDYTNDACMYMFSAGQATRSENYVNNYLVGQLKDNVCGPVAEPTCDDGIMNGDETGVDCGGSCAAVCPTCDDGIMNGDETDVDCGGSCNACPCLNNTTYVNITFDQYGSETTWEVVDANNNVVASGDSYENGDISISEMVCLDDACYTFNIYDTYGDGICCQYGNGVYTVLDENNTVLVSGGEFAASESMTFCLNSTPTCDDGVMNGDETGVDCGGSCAAACPTCDDGIMNGNETGIDCGGDCQACPTCNDGIMNGDETGVDCGGSCTTVCSTCDDGIMNGDETGVDCGGSACQACVCNNNTIYVEITTDNYPGETSWEITSLDGTILAAGGNYTQIGFISEMVCLDDACYSFYIYDSFGDGICCAEGNGNYAVVDANGNVLVSGGEFGDFEMQGFCLGDIAPTCDDGVMNGDETGVDCGGSCATICPTCTDGVMNGNETGVDCGGDCEACPTCTDGVMNGNETGVDCGGDCAACPTCDDGILNGAETGLDCGGPDCMACNCSENALTLTIVLDGYGAETGWTFTYENGNAFVGYGNYENGFAGDTYTYDICVADGCYQFIIADAFGDGMCCEYGEGSYTLTDANGNVLAAGAQFGASESTTFCVPAPTCFDGEMNGNETGIDCGGDCEPCVAECGIATGLIETNPTATGITLQWDEQPAATSYQLAGRKAGGNWKVFPETPNTSRTFTDGIQPNTTYQWTVRVMCDGQWTDWALPVAEFTTGGAARLSGNAATFDAFDNTESFLTSSIYPNPAKNEVTVETMSTTENSIQIRLLDLAGKLLIEKTIDAGTLQTRTSLDISNLQNGYYLIEVNNGLENSISKVSVIR